MKDSLIESHQPLSVLAIYFNFQQNTLSYTLIHNNNCFFHTSNSYQLTLLLYILDCCHLIQDTHVISTSSTTRTLSSPFIISKYSRLLRNTLALQYPFMYNSYRVRHYTIQTLHLVTVNKTASKQIKLYKLILVAIHNT